MKKIIIWLKNFYKKPKKSESSHFNISKMCYKKTIKNSKKYKNEVGIFFNKKGTKMYVSNGKGKVEVYSLPEYEH